MAAFAVLAAPLISNDDAPSAPLALLSFGAGEPPWRVPLAVLAGAGSERWPALGAIACGEEQGLSWRNDGAHLFLGLWLPDEDIELAAERAYRAIFATLDRLGFPHLLRTWNYFPRIGQGAGENERYRAFVRGRARAFAGRLAPGGYPAATAIGSQTPGLVIHALAARRPAESIENPRQVPAWRYPARYGLVPPAFARATLTAEGLLLISGTASVVGHESRHRGNLGAQFAEAWRNLEALSAIAAQRGGGGRLAALRVYLRDPSLLPELMRLLPREVPQVVLQGEICRPELLVELEGVWAPFNSAASSPPAADG